MLLCRTAVMRNGIKLHGSTYSMHAKNRIPDTEREHDGSPANQVIKFRTRIKSFPNRELHRTGRRIKRKGSTKPVFEIRQSHVPRYRPDCSEVVPKLKICIKKKGNREFIAIFQTC